jgi:hypothetical protein
LSNGVLARVKVEYAHLEQVKISKHCSAIYFDHNDELFSSRVSFVVWDRQTQQNLALPSQLIEPASYPLLFPRGHGGINADILSKERRSLSDFGLPEPTAVAPEETLRTPPVVGNASASCCRV